jgi:hypothetical protein
MLAGFSNDYVLLNHSSLFALAFTTKLFLIQIEQTRQPGGLGWWGNICVHSTSDDDFFRHISSREHATLEVIQTR